MPPNNTNSEEMFVSDYGSTGSLRILPGTEKALEEFNRAKKPPNNTNSEEIE